MPHIAPVILKRRPGFLGTPKRPPLWALGTGIGRGAERRTIELYSVSVDTTPRVQTTLSLVNSNPKASTWRQALHVSQEVRNAL